MPSMTVYSSYETLTLFQSIAKYGTDASTFQNISTALTKNDFDLQHEHQNAERLSVNALRGLYEEVVNHDEKAQDIAKVNGDLHNGERSPKRRKLSASPPADNDVNRHEQEQERMYELVDKLYARYKEEALKEIRKEEEDYARLRKEIDSLEAQVTLLDNGNSEDRAATMIERPSQTNNASAPGIGVSNGKVDVLDQKADIGNATSDASQFAQKSDRPTAVVTHPGPGLPPSQRTMAPSPAPSDATFVGQSTAGSAKIPQANQNLQSQQLQRATQLETSNPVSKRSKSPRSNAGTPIPQAQAQAQRQQQTTSSMPIAPNVQHRPAIRQNAAHRQMTPVPSQPQQYPTYAQYPPQWHPQMGQSPYAQHPGYVPPPYYAQPMPGRHPQTPHPPQYQHYPPHTAPVQYAPSHAWHGYPYGPYPASAATTPTSRPESWMSATHSGSSTPWKTKRNAGHQRQSTPPPPDRAISPIEPDVASPPTTMIRNPKQSDSKTIRRPEVETPAPQTKPARRGRPPSKTPSAVGPSRSLSRASHASDTVSEQVGPSRRTERIKLEPPSTPLPPPSDSETHKSSGRRGRPRNNTLASQVEANRTITGKRKRETISPSPSINTPSATPGSGHSGNPHNASIKHDPSLVLVSKNFSRTSQLLLNELTSHKLAGIFAKPLSERDAPGYKDLVHRPQDLKSVKAAISRGSRAALAAIEALEADKQVDNTPLKPGATGTSPAVIGNGFYLVTKAADLIPPRAIVNGAQLEMELIRMFANAIMFNPLPSSERGFGRNLKLRKNGGDLEPNRSRIPDSQNDETDDDRAGEESDSTMTGGAGWDEGGIIGDAREMFDDVGEAVDKWRTLEGERMGSSSQNVESSRIGGIATPSLGTHLDVMTGRHASVSASSNIGDDEGDGGSTPVPASVSTTRKRRRIAER